MKVSAAFSKIALFFMRDLLHNIIVDEGGNSIQTEVSGSLMLSPLPSNKYIIDINLLNGVLNGNNKNVGFPVESHFNYHTHPLDSYVYFKTHKGWPSDKDYKVIIKNFLTPYGRQIYFSCISSIEGIYIISFNLELLKSDMSFKKITNIIEKYYKKSKKVKSFKVENIQYFNKDIQKYLQELKKIPSNKQLFSVKLLSWYSLFKENSPIFFKFKYPKTRGSCQLNN